MNLVGRLVLIGGAILALAYFVNQPHDTPTPSASVETTSTRALNEPEWSNDLGR
jgi:hypothetical protein